MVVDPGAASVAEASVKICCHLPVAAFHQALPDMRLIATRTCATPVSSAAVPDTTSGVVWLGRSAPAAGLVTAAVGGALPPASSPNAYRKPSLLVMYRRPSAIAGDP